MDAGALPHIYRQNQLVQVDSVPTIKVTSTVLMAASVKQGLMERSRCLVQWPSFLPPYHEIQPMSSLVEPDKYYKISRKYAVLQQYLLQIFEATEESQGFLLQFL